MNQKRNSLPAEPVNPSSSRPAGSLELTPLPLAKTAACPLCRRKAKLVAVEAAAKGTTEYTFECSYSGCTKDNIFVVIQNDYERR
jgi:hypothetical protein